MNKQDLRKLREAVKRELNDIGDRALRMRVAKMRRTAPTITREDAVLAVAAGAGIIISEYTRDQATLDRVRQVLQGQTVSPAVDALPLKKKPTSRTLQVIIAGNLKLTDPVLPRRIIEEAKMMAGRVYPKLYVLENSVREVICRVMENAHGANWWNTRVPKSVREEVDRRKAGEKRRPWHGKRGVHNIHYTDIAHLKRIVNANQQDFNVLFPDLNWFNHIVDVITPSRNVSSHHNPVGSRDVRRIDVYFEDWHNHIAERRHLIPN